MQTPGIGGLIQLQLFDRCPVILSIRAISSPVCFDFAKETLQERRRIRLDTRDGGPAGQ
jgi:hypothetical protein